MDKNLLTNLIVDNKSTYEISNELQIPRTTINYWLKKYNLKTNKKQVITKTHKICAKCKQNKSHDLFYGRYDTKSHNLSSYCKKCSDINVLNRMKIFKKLCIEYKGGSCFICNYSKSQNALEFHHNIPSEKEFNISEYSTTVFSDKIKQELDKCILVCANCHREIHDTTI